MRWLWIHGKRGHRVRQPQRSASGPVPPFGRPFSTPNASIAASVLSPSTSNGRIHSPTPVRAADRSSTASLPLPMLTPYHTLNPNRNLAHRSNLATDNEATNSMVVDGNLSLNIPPLPSSTYSRSSSSMSHPHARSTSPPPYSPLSPPRSLHAHSPSYWQRRHGHTVNGHDSEEIPSSTSYPGVGGTGPGSRHHQLFYRDRSSLTSSISSEQSFPPPAPPTVLTPPPEEMAASNSAPHASILSQAGPAREEEIYIAVETVAREYRLLVRLPGYRRDSITLSIRKRRILHLVADSWEPGGGHFERRISFGYDAELSQVRAEFDGETLRVIVPRRGQPPVVYRNSRD
ncbi:hypothetical protein C8Q75DRAFT_265791 [Abortiporus biennis]|nr:hypothetical protein C8Q75DRAFT_265791 [Abortiporus biennis]